MCLSFPSLAPLPLDGWMGAEACVVKGLAGGLLGRRQAWPALWALCVGSQSRSRSRRYGGSGQGQGSEARACAQPGARWSQPRIRLGGGVPRIARLRRVGQRQRAQEAPRAAAIL